MQKIGWVLKKEGWMYLIRWKDLGQEAVVWEMNCPIPVV
jgi:hypothetical protein